MSESTRSRARSKPKKPYDDFPLFPHATRRWAKKIRGKMHYFGPWEDWQAALNLYLEQRDDLHAGRTPRVQGDGLTVRDLANRFLTFKRQLLDSAEITPRTFKDYFNTCERILDIFGRTRLVVDLASDDFERLRSALAKTMGVVALGNEVQRVRVLFKYAYDADLIDRPIRYGPGFKRPSRKSLRLSRRTKGLRMFEVGELRRMIDGAGVFLRPLILLGVNCGLGNTDVAQLPLHALDFSGGWLDYPRPKTGVPRRCPLWPETIAAIRAAQDKRPTAKDEASAALAVITRKGHAWVTSKTIRGEDQGAVIVRFDDAVSKETRKLLMKLGLDRPGLNFYALRHTFETIGGETLDQAAVDAIMGHIRDDMPSVYRERISDERLKAVTDHVRKWLFAEKKPARKKSGRGKGEAPAALEREAASK